MSTSKLLVCESGVPSVGSKQNDVSFLAFFEGIQYTVPFRAS